MQEEASGGGPLPLPRRPARHVPPSARRRAGHRARGHKSKQLTGGIPSNPRPNPGESLPIPDQISSSTTIEKAPKHTRALSELPRRLVVAGTGGAGGRAGDGEEEVKADLASRRACRAPAAPRRRGRRKTPDLEQQSPEGEKGREATGGGTSVER